VDTKLKCIDIYTDGSCHPQWRLGAWAAIIIIDSNEFVLSGLAEDTTHQRMELTAVIEAVKHLKNLTPNYGKIHIHTDSQYVVSLRERLTKLRKGNFKTAKGKPIWNSDLIQSLQKLLENIDLHFIKVNAHQKRTEWRNLNREVDKLARKKLRDGVRKTTN